MIDYRLYFMSANGKHIERFEPVVGVSDHDAIAVAAQHICAQPLELWRLNRKVHVFDALLGPRSIGVKSYA